MSITFKNITFIRGYGQMCNSLLQYAHAYAWGLEHGGRTFVSLRLSHKYRYFELSKRPELSTANYIIGTLLYRTRLVPRLYLKHPEEATPERMLTINNQSCNILRGWYFRSYECFIKHKAAIREMFGIQPQFLTRIRPYIETHSAGADIRLGVHIRRGDYLTHNGGIHFFDDETYIEYIRQFCAQFPDKKVSVFICTNDPDLDIEKYRTALQNPAVFLPKGNEIEDLYTLSVMDYIIGVRSTFSLVASLYHETPFFWITQERKPLTMEGFFHFDEKLMQA